MPTDPRTAPRPLSRHAPRFWGLIALCLACEPAEQGPLLDLPRRDSAAPDGTMLVRELTGLDLDAREERIVGEIMAGNVPAWLRQLRRVEMAGEVEGRTHRVVLWVTPDYLSVGTDNDYLPVPLTPQTAQRLAGLLGASLPTPKIVDAVWAATRSRLSPQRIQPFDSIGSLSTVRYFERHGRLVRAQRTIYGVLPHAFVAGHKKDVVLTATLPQYSGRVAIYGWHGRNGRPLQELSTVLSERTVYYNHGVRLVDRDVLVDGAPMDLEDVLRDPALAPLVSDGVIEASPYR
jgi:hypothetical protein